MRPRCCLFIYAGATYIWPMKCTQCGGTGKLLGPRPLEHLQGSMHPRRPSPGPAQHPGQLDVRAQMCTGRLQDRRQLQQAHHRLYLRQRARQPRGQTVRQLRKGTTPLGAIPAGNLRSRRGDTRVGAVTGESASATATGMKRAARKTCIEPGMLANILLAGVLPCITKLHRSQARTAATLAGLLVSEGPAIVPRLYRPCPPLVTLG